jgi:hypothetical protein
MPVLFPNSRLFSKRTMYSPKGETLGSFPTVIAKNRVALEKQSAAGKRFEP